jgi:hypothetical protein
MSKITRMGALRVADPGRWEKEIRGAMKNTPTIQDAADKLGVSKRQLQRWLDELPDVARPPEGRRPKESDRT